MSIEEHINEIDNPNNKLKYLSKVISELDTESFELFKEVMDLGDESVYKINTLFERGIYLSGLLNETLDAVNKINKEEASNFEYAQKRFQLKSLLIAMVTMSSFLTNALLGIFSFVALSKIANKSYVEDIAKIYDSIDIIDDEQVLVVIRTLSNCSRILHGKAKRILGHLSEIKDDVGASLEIMICNDAIKDYILGNASIEQINGLDEIYKLKIIDILKNDLNTDCTDLSQLLILAREKNNKGLKLKKEYYND